MKKICNWILVISCAVFIFGGCAWGILKSDGDFSISERRHLATRPVLTLAGLWDGSFSEELDDYVCDQFPLREEFRRIYSVFSYDILKRKDVNNIYIVDDYACKIESTISQESVDWGSQCFNYICENYSMNQVYFCMIPDKNYFLAKENGYPYLDYDSLCEKYMEAMTKKVNFLDITDQLTIDSYYKTDTHWSQDSLIPVAQKLGEAMGSQVAVDYEKEELDKDFYGVYYGQSALPLDADRIYYLTNSITDSYEVTLYDTGKPQTISVYDMEKAFGNDPYEMFLSGSRSLITIENPLAEEEKELVIFRDSFSSSLAPLLATGYSKVTLVDIRYISPRAVGQFVDFENADILFAYSVQVLNNCKGQFLK